MPILQVYIDEKTEGWLRHASEQHGRTVEDLAESAVSEAALGHAKREGLIDAQIKRTGRHGAQSS